MSIAFLLGAVSCTDLLDPSLRNVGQVIPEGATLTIGFGVPAEVSTKAATMASDPTIESIHVFVFDEAGTLLQVRKATIGDSAVTANYDDANETPAMKSSWFVDNILMSAEKRVLHFVANIADDQVPTSGSETSIFQSLAVTAPNAAYWQRIELSSILPYKYRGGGTYSYVDDNGVFQQDQPVKGTGVADDGSYTDENGFPVNVGDYIDRESNKIVNGTGYYADEAVSAKVALIPLVRNFARIEFTNSWSSFTLKKIALAYEPKAGLVAPFNGGFASEYVNLTAGQKPNMNSSTYTPLLPAAGVNQDCPTQFINVTDNQATLFIYERGIPTDYATCVLIGGVLTGATDAEKDSDGNTWFKIEIASTEGAYFKIYRDCTYLMNVTSIDATAARYPSPEDAFDASPVGDISNSPETATLTQITDGNGLTLWVHEIDHPDLSGNKIVPLLYTFFYESESNVSYFPGKVSFTRDKKPGSTLGYATTETVTASRTPLTSSSEYYSLIPETPVQHNWYLAQVTLNSKGDEPLQSIIHVEGKVTTEDGVPSNKTLSRDVTYTVMGQQELGLDASKLGVDEAGQPVVVTIKLPNTLGPSMFPLTLKIEAEDNNLSPTDNLAVETGKSSFDGSKNTYYFLKTVSYTEYQALANTSPAYSLSCAFVTTKSTGKDPVTKIRVTEKIKEGDTRESWFKGGDDATVELKVGPAFIITPPNSVSVKASEISVSFSLVSTGTENTSWTLSANNGATVSDGTNTGTTISGSGNATITVNFPANTSETTPVKYTVSATRTGFQNQKFEITQQPKPLVYTFSASEFNNFINYTARVPSSDENVAIEVRQAALTGTGANAYLTLGRRTGGTTYRGSIIVTPKTGLKVTGIKVTYSSSTYAGFDFDGDDNSVTVNTGIYTRDENNSSTATWSGSSTSSVEFTNGYTTSGWITTTYNFPRITSIQVTCEQN